MKTEPRTPTSLEESSANSDLSETLDSIIKGLGKNGSSIELDLGELESKTGKSEGEIKKALVKLGYIVNEASENKPDPKDNSKDKTKKAPKVTKQVDKTGWTDVDHKLEDAVNRLRNTKDQTEKDKILEEIKALKEEKFPKTNPPKTTLTKSPKPSHIRAATSSSNNILPSNVYSEDILGQIDDKKDAAEKAILNEKLRKDAVEYAYGEGVGNKEDPTATPETVVDSRAFEDDYTPKRSYVEGVKEAVAEKERRDFIEEAEKHGAFEGDYIPREKSTKENIETSPSPTLAPEEIKNSQVDLTISLINNAEGDATKSKENGDGFENLYELIANEIDNANLQDSLLNDIEEVKTDIERHQKSEIETGATRSSTDFRERVAQNAKKETLVAIAKIKERIANEINAKFDRRIIEAESTLKDNPALNEEARVVFVQKRKEQIENERKALLRKLFPFTIEEPASNKAEETAIALSEQLKSSRLERAKKIGERAFEFYKKIGDEYNKLPLKTKILVSLGLTVATFTIGGVAVTAASTGVKIAAATGLSLTLERALAASYSENTGKERTGLRKFAHMSEATAAAFLITFFGAEAVKNIGEAGGVAIDKIKSIFNLDSTQTVSTSIDAQNAGEAQKLAENIAKQNLEEATAGGQSEAQKLAENAAKNNLEEITKVSEKISSYTVASGDNLTKIIQEKILANSGLTGHQLNNATENILAAMKSDPASFGVKSGNLDLINVGDNIDIEKIKGLANSIKINGLGLFENTSKLNAELPNYISKDAATEIVSKISEKNLTDGNVNSLNTWSGEGENVATSESVEKIADEKIVESNITTQSEMRTVSTSNNIDQNSRVNSELVEQANFKAELELKKVIEDTYGRKGFFGFLKSDGMEIWNNIKNTPVSELESYRGSAELGGSASNQNYLSQPQNLERTQKIISGLGEATGLKPNENEKIGEYVFRMIKETKLNSLTAKVTRT